jgi:hypothetical protein
MKEQRTDILSPVVLKSADAICFTSNGVVKSNNELVMGAGIARTFKDKWPKLPQYFGELVKRDGNIVNLCREYRPLIVSFPTKHHWRDKSDIDLIRKSAILLKSFADFENWNLVYLPRPGCANGGLSWEREVRPVIENILDDRFIIVSL